ncbi:unnamed protein product [Linum trigynum]|uniref:ADP-ribosyl cyclase/cyclic ADP-ribose hydrolase n=1 Tax=Linum trigynum TaxID=586398 RepID=A0AAV2GHY8_9ROSI
MTTNNPPSTGASAALLLILLLDLSGAICPANGDRRRPRYDVFLSHRGPDGRHKFADHLDSALRRKRIKVFRDDRDLPRGEKVTEAISRAIDESVFSLLVLTPGFASSEYCLDELVQIMQSREKGRHRTFPIFKGVSPDDDVADPSSSGLYKADLDRHKLRYSYERVASWIHALDSISHIAGWEITDQM